MKELMESILNKIANEIKNDEVTTAPSRFIDAKTVLYSYNESLIDKENYISGNNMIIDYKLGTNENGNGEYNDIIDVSVLISMDTKDTIISLSNNKDEFLQEYISGDSKIDNKWDYSEKINNILNTEDFSSLNDESKENYKEKLNEKFFGNDLAVLHHETTEDKLLKIESDLEKYIEFTKDRLDDYEMSEDNLVEAEKEDKSDAWKVDEDCENDIDSWE